MRETEPGSTPHLSPSAWGSRLPQTSGQGSHLHRAGFHRASGEKVENGVGLNRYEQTRSRFELRSVADQPVSPMLGLFHEPLLLGRAVSVNVVGHVVQGKRTRLHVGLGLRSTVGATELSETHLTSSHLGTLNQAEDASPHALRSLSHPGGRRFESG